MLKSFLTPARKMEIYNKVKDSKFYGNINLVSNKYEVNKFIDKIKNKYSDASHNVSAYKIGIGENTLANSDDDGEPAGSSGPPILQTINGEGLTNTIIVITRYFGGTKLGIGGLIRAYGNTAKMVINEAGKQKLNLVYKIVAEGSYNLIGKIMGQIESYSGKILDTKYDNNGGKITFLIKPDSYKMFKEKVIEKTGNTIKLKIIKELYL